MLIYQTPTFKIEVADTVGTGDAFLAGLFAQVKPLDALRFGAACGAYVASQKGATPVLDLEWIEQTLIGG